MKPILTFLIVSVVAVITACGRVDDGREKDKTVQGGASSPDVVAAQSAAAAPAYVSHNVLNNNTIEVYLSKECTDATVTNTANYILNGGLNVQSVAKDAVDKTKLIITTTTQQAQSYTLTILNLTSTDGVSISGVIQVVFTGLSLPTATFNFRNPADQSALPTTLGVIQLCDSLKMNQSQCSVQPYYNKTGVDILVSGANVAAYRYKLDAGGWSSAVPVATPLQIGGLSEGYHTIYFVVQHTLGYWQETTSPDVKTFSWVQDSLPPADAILDPVTLPAASPLFVTASQSVNMRVIGSEIAYYRLCLTNGAYTDCTTNTFQGGPDSVNTNISIPNSYYTSILTPGTVTFKVIGYDASGNAQSTPATGGTFTYTIDTNNVEAVYRVSDLPSSINNGVNSVSINVLSTYGAVTYIGQIIDGTDCSTVPWVALSASPVALSTPLSRTGMTDSPAQKTACAIGRNLAGAWQGNWSGAGTPPNITKYTWVIDTSAPTALIYWKAPISAPSSTVQVAGYQFQVSSTGGASHYRYAVVSGAGTACSTGTYSVTPITIETDIAVDPPAIATSGTTVYKVCVIAGDLAGNWQLASAATATAEWTVDLDPPSANPSFAALSASARSFNTAALTFSIDNATATADTFYYQIQVATDSSFTTVVGDTTVKSCKAISLPDCPAALGTKDFSIAVDAFQSPSYYARVKAGDVLGNMRASFSATSAEHYVVGKISGTVRNQANAVVVGETVTLRSSTGADLSAVYPAQVTNASGAFVFDNVRTAKLNYQVRVAEGSATYFPATKRYITVQDKGVSGTIQTNVGVIPLATIAGSSAQNVTAKVVDADDGWLLGYADVTLIDYQGNIIGTQRSVDSTCTTIPGNGPPITNQPKHTVTASPTCGDIAFTAITPGTYTIRVNGDSWYSLASANQRYNDLNVEDVVVHSSTANKGRIPIVRTMSGQDLKIVLAWGAANPADLDLHVVGTLPAGQTLSATSVPNSQTINGDSGSTSLFHTNWRGGASTWQQQYSVKTRSYVQPAAYWDTQTPRRFPVSPDTNVALVQDTTTGYGPEAQNFFTGYTDGTYWVTVVNYREWNPTGGLTKANQQWDQANVQLRVYDASGLAFEITASAPSTAPTVGPGGTAAVAGCNSTVTTDWYQCEVWNAFKITVSGSGSAGRQYIPVNTYVDWGAGGGYDAIKGNLSGF